MSTGLERSPTWAWVAGYGGMLVAAICGGTAAYLNVGGELETWLGRATAAGIVVGVVGLAGMSRE